MKKSRYALLIALCFTLIFSMCACDLLGKKDPEKKAEEEQKIVITDAKSLLDAIENATSKTAQFQISGKTEAVFTVEGKKITVTGDSKVIIMTANEKISYYYNENKASTKAADNTQTQTEVVAYYNGNAYISNAENSSYLYSPMTADEFSDFIADDSSFENILDATKQEYKQNDDGTWTLEVSGYSKKALEALMKNFDPDGTFGELFEIMDIEWKFVTNDQFQLTELNLNFCFDEDTVAEGDKFTMSFTDAQYENVTQITEPFTGDKYQQADNLKILRQVEDFLKDLKASENASFRLKSKTALTAGGTKNTYQEIDAIKFGVENNAYFFNIDASVGTQKTVMVYKDGKYTATSNGQSQSQSLTDKEAKAIINQLVDAADISRDRITSIQAETVNKRTTYTLTSTTTPPENVLTTCNLAVQTIEIIVEDGKITQIISYKTFTGTYQAGYPAELKVEAILTFQ